MGEVSGVEFGPRFDSKGRCSLGARRGADVVLTKRAWEKHLKSHPDRGWYRFNFEEIRQAVGRPDQSRKSRRIDGVMLLYKKVDRIWLDGRTSIPRKGYWCVVVRSGGKVLTVYFTKKIKAGRPA